jgi:hypothetical protein
MAVGIVKTPTAKMTFRKMTVARGHSTVRKLTPAVVLKTSCSSFASKTPPAVAPLAPEASCSMSDWESGCGPFFSSEEGSIVVMMEEPARCGEQQCRKGRVFLVWGRTANSKVDLYVRCSEHQVRRPNLHILTALATIHACHALPCRGKRRQRPDQGRIASN